MLKPVYTSKRSLNYKLCIMTAGKGTRNWYALINNTNKALLPLGETTVIEHIIDNFPSIEVVIALGYQGEKVRAVTNVLYPNRKITYVEVDDTKRGPGYSLLCCEPELQCPFVYSACDTIVTRRPPSPNYYNWLGVARVKEKLPYLTMDTHDGKVLRVYDKGDENATDIASIGLVGVHDYKTFWKGLSKPTIVQGEHQDTSGLNALIKSGLVMETFEWFDTGSTEGYENANEYFNQNVS